MFSSQVKLSKQSAMQSHEVQYRTVHKCFRPCLDPLRRWHCSVAAEIPVRSSVTSLEEIVRFCKLINISAYLRQTVEFWQCGQRCRRFRWSATS